MKSNTWKIQLTIEINFISLDDDEKGRVMHSRSDNIKFTSYNDANEDVDELFDSLCSRYQGKFQTSMRKNDFKVNFRRGGSYVDSPDWI